MGKDVQWMSWGFHVVWRLRVFEEQDWDAIWMVFSGFLDFFVQFGLVSLLGHISMIMATYQSN